MCATSAARFEPHYAYSSTVDLLLLVACPSTFAKAEQFIFAVNSCNIALEKLISRIKANAQLNGHLGAIPFG